MPFGERRWPLGGEAGDEVDVQTTADVEVCERWIRDFRESGRDCVGLDIEWKANTVKGQRPEPVATLQLATETSALVLQVLYFRPGECAGLRDLLADETVLKLGVGIKGDLLKLLKDCNLHCAGGLDLSKHFKSTLGLRIKEEIGLKRLAKFVLGFDLDKPKMVSRSDWSTSSLDEAQIKYAALDAVVACKIFQRLRSCDDFARSAISLRTNYYLRKSFASRKLKQQGWSKRLLVFGCVFLLIWSPSLVLAGFMTPNQVQRDVVCAFWGLCSLLKTVQLWGTEMCKYDKPLSSYVKPDAQELFQGVLTGTALTGLFYLALWFFGFGTIAPSRVGGGAGVLRAAGLGILSGFTKELLFRGVVQKELERDLKPDGKAALVLGLIFASAHLSPHGFVGLALLSLCLSEGKKAFGGSLSYSIGLHSSLVATTMLGSSAYVQTYPAPVWLVGSSGQSPLFLEGALGIALLSVLRLGLQNKKRRKKRRAKKKR
ncbi:ribonuclease H-like protein [Chloropicon primus]|uniref:3'-5' exonuclease n=2 Tax=Chloropicon primus TaxID=1764295 RepID=A0A5B8MJS7_9CHLO|nr:ribonuclease H-like protein [Chloropicon primus]|eukprot:QDZ20726.1 ribonuclease H-like protein [Chloropicon primus]